MKVGREPAADLERVRAARNAIGDAALFVDANGAYSRKQALRLAERFAEAGVSWFEEPVSCDDLAGLRLLRDRAPSGMDIAAGEYGYDICYFRRMLEAGAVDVLQADATRCAGITGFMRVAALCDAFHVPLSSHCAPSIARPSVLRRAAGAASRILLRSRAHRSDALRRRARSAARQARARPVAAGLGLDFKRTDAARYAA